MKRGIAILCAATVGIAVAGFALAQPVASGPAANADQAFFDAHPKIERQLAKDPSLIDNQKFVAGHPALHEYLRTHKNVRAEFKDHPENFVHREATSAPPHN